ncbi:MAG: protease HtpX [Elusimicrobiota bacterium]|nr:protease HtpX [Elusimicrobiota bacterium]
MAKRLFLFMLVNVLVVLTISITLNLLGVRPYLSARGIDYGALLAFCLVWGMGGAFISLALSRVMAKWSMGVQLVDDRHELAVTVHRLAAQAGLPAMPEVGIYDSPEPNAFATGPTKSRALVAVSTGLLERMSADEVEGVLGHEVAHIANGDMVTMTLVQGVINAFVMFLARVLGWFIASQMSRGDDRERSSFGLQYLITMVLEIAFSVLGMFVVAWFSRLREYRADAGGARLAGREKMIRALMALQRTFQPVDQVGAVSALKIAGGSGGLMALLSTHPPLEVRIKRLSEAVL